MPSRNDDEMDPALAKHLGHQVKAILRKRLRGVRKALSASDVAERSKRITERLLTLPELSGARSVALFWPMEGKNEVDLRSLDSILRERDVRVCYPSLDRETNLMTFRFVETVGAMEELGSGFSEPAPTAPEASSVDVVIVPCLAIDPRGHRIGYGAGYYDRTLPRFSPPGAAIAVAFDFQLVPEVPITETDRTVDAIVTDRQTLRATLSAELVSP